MKLKVDKGLLALVTIEEFKKPLEILFWKARANRTVKMAVLFWGLFFAMEIFNVVARQDFAPDWMYWTAENITHKGVLCLIPGVMATSAAAIIMKMNVGLILKDHGHSISKLENLVELFTEDVLIIDKTKIREFIGMHLRQQAFETRLFKPSSPDAKASQEKFNRMYDAAKARGWADEYKKYWSC